MEQLATTPLQDLPHKRMESFVIRIIDECECGRHINIILDEHTYSIRRPRNASWTEPITPGHYRVRLAPTQYTGPMLELLRKI